MPTTSGILNADRPKAAPDMLRGVQWPFWGAPVENPGKPELLRNDS
jgi:hypothetical protein